MHQLCEIVWLGRFTKMLLPLQASFNVTAQTVLTLPTPSMLVSKDLTKNKMGLCQT